MTYVRPLFVLVTGATGKQGGEVINSLLDFGHIVRGMTRNPESKRAKFLADQGVEIVRGDFKDSDSLREALKGVDAAFLMGTPFEEGVEEETNQGITFINLAKEIGLKHLIYSSVGSAHKKTGIPHFESKFRVEEHLRKIDIPYTIVRPVYFMENLLAPWAFPALREGKIEAPMPPDRKLAMLALHDLGRFVVHVLENRKRFLGQAIDIASDKVSHGEIARILSRVLDRKIKFHQQSYSDIEAYGDDMVKMYKWMNEFGYDVDLVELKSNYPIIKWTRFDEWAEERDWSVLQEPIATHIN